MGFKKVGSTLRFITYHFLCACLCTSSSWADLATEQCRIGSFGNAYREPPILEISRLVAGESAFIKLDNMLDDATEAIIIISTDVNKVHLPGANGSIGPNLENAVIYPLSASDNYRIDFNLDNESAGDVAYIQGAVTTSSGKRILTNMVHAIVAPHDDFPDSNPPINTNVNLSVSESLPGPTTGVRRENGHVQVGIPLPRGLISNSQQLGMNSSVNAAQFNTLKNWPDGSVQWVLAEFQTDLEANQEKTVSVRIDGNANGNFGGSNIASQNGGVVSINTGPLQATLSASDSLFDSLTVFGSSLIDQSVPNTFLLLEENFDSCAYRGDEVEIIRNGPVRAEVKLSGHLSCSSFRVNSSSYLHFYKGKTGVRMDFSLENTDKNFKSDLIHNGYSYFLRMPAASGSSYDLRFPTVSTNGVSSGTTSSMRLNSGEGLFEQNFAIREGHTGNPNRPMTSDHNSSSYKPQIKRISTNQFEREGSLAMVGNSPVYGDTENPFSYKTKFSYEGFMQVKPTSGATTIIAAIKDSAYEWPVSVSVKTNRILAFNHHPLKSQGSDYPYNLPAASISSKTFFLIPELSASSNPNAKVKEFNNELTARVSSKIYNQSGALPYRLLSAAERWLFYNSVKLPQPPPKNFDPVKMKFKYIGGTGGGNNSSSQGVTPLLQGLLVKDDDALFLGSRTALYTALHMPYHVKNGGAPDMVNYNHDDRATKKGRQWDGSKHTFVQAVPVRGLTYGETRLLESWRALKETILEDNFTSTAENPNFVQGTGNRIHAVALDVLLMKDDAELENWVKRSMEEHLLVTYRDPDSLPGADTDRRGWVEPMDEPNPRHGVWVSYGSRKPEAGFTKQFWVGGRHTADAIVQMQHRLSIYDPSSPLLDYMSKRGAHLSRAARFFTHDDGCDQTGAIWESDTIAGDHDLPNLMFDPEDYELGPALSGANTSAYIELSTKFIDKTDASRISHAVEMVRSLGESAYSGRQYNPFLHEAIANILEALGMVDFFRRGGAVVVQ